MNCANIKILGVITTMCMDSFQNCLILGTGCGYHTCIDLRFRLPITSVVHPYSKLNSNRSIFYSRNRPSFTRNYVVFSISVFVLFFYKVEKLLLFFPRTYYDFLGISIEHTCNLLFAFHEFYFNSE